MASLFKGFSKVPKFLNVLYKQSPCLPKINKYSTLITKLSYTKFGNPMDVIRKTEGILEPLKPGEVLVKMLASPINPADINTIQGRYPSLPKLPAVAGNEGVGEIVDVGPDVYKVEVGDRVIPLTNNSGTWGTHVILNEDVIYKVPSELGLLEAATLKVNPCTAYRMLNDFVELKTGDTVLQNGGNSACGQYVIQLCHAWNIHTVNVVRNRPNVEDLKHSLKELGASYVLTEEELQLTTLFKEEIIPRPSLALNCVGGRSATELLRHLKSGGTMVTYGGMSKEPVIVPTSALIFKDVEILGYWMTRWSSKNIGEPAMTDMFDDLISLMMKDKLHGPVCQMIGIGDYKEALTSLMDSKGMVGKKFVLRY